MDEILSVEEAARLLGVNENTIRSRLKKGTMEGKKVGRDWVLLRSSVLKYPKGRRDPGRPPKERTE